MPRVYTVLRHYIYACTYKQSGKKGIFDLNFFRIITILLNFCETYMYSFACTTKKYFFVVA